MLKKRKAYVVLPVLAVMLGGLVGCAATTMTYKPVTLQKAAVKEQAAEEKKEGSVKAPDYEKLERPGQDKPAIPPPPLPPRTPHRSEAAPDAPGRRDDQRRKHAARRLYRLCTGRDPQGLLHHGRGRHEKQEACLLAHASGHAIGQGTGAADRPAAKKTTSTWSSGQAPSISSTNRPPSSGKNSTSASAARLQTAPPASFRWSRCVMSDPTSFCPSSRTC